MADIVFEQVTCHYPGADTPAVSELDLAITDGELFVVCGAPEAGKSTVLRMLAGLVPVTSGRILVGGHELTEDHEPVMSLVFQNYALYPNLTVAQNIALPLSELRLAKKEVTRRVREAAAQLDLGDVLGRTGETMPAGQRIRIALARGLVREPAALLMDEPLANLEPRIRAEIAQLIVDAQRRHGITTVYASADPEEALALGDRVALLEHGVLREVAVPEDVAPGRPGQRAAAPD
jgi:multiple sugar transport system ATP-binding protein